MQLTLNCNFTNQITDVNQVDRKNSFDLQKIKITQKQFRFKNTKNWKYDKYYFLIKTVIINKS